MSPRKINYRQTLYTPTTFREERVLCRSVIQLNIVRSARTMMDAISSVRLQFVDSAGDGGDDAAPHVSRAPQNAPHSPRALLIAKFIPLNEDELTSLIGSSWTTVYYSTIAVGAAIAPRIVRSLSALVLRGNGPLAFLEDTDTGTPGRDEAQEILCACSDDIISLWNDNFIREVLRRRKMRLKGLPGFFLNGLERITTLDYIPSDDCLNLLPRRRAARTFENCERFEYRFEMEAVAGREQGTEWRIVDVGGSRSHITANQIVRRVLARLIHSSPYINDTGTMLRGCGAIIFLTRISRFDRVLAEDRSVNKLVTFIHGSLEYQFNQSIPLLEDSVLLLENRLLLANIDLDLSLNKCDFLVSKLTSGIRLSKSVRRNKFTAIQHDYSPLPQQFYGFCTSVTVGVVDTQMIIPDLVYRFLARTPRQQRDLGERPFGAVSNIPSNQHPAPLHSQPHPAMTVSTGVSLLSAGANFKRQPTHDSALMVAKPTLLIDSAIFPTGTTGFLMWVHTSLLSRPPFWSAHEFVEIRGHGIGTALSRGSTPTAGGASASRTSSSSARSTRDITSGARNLGFERLTMCPIQTTLLDTSLFTAEETAWLNAYHAEVACKVAPLLRGRDARALAWLEKQCRAI
ncbi:G-protein alpha subunit-domain-containing protein [Melanogaster broomeanus]|nr:G-protein alpha subunit-domain-containing protein [Melanogaster broomeanus]